MSPQKQIGFLMLSLNAALGVDKCVIGDDLNQRHETRTGRGSDDWLNPLTEGGREENH